jgi:hypothetical protein
MCHKRLRRFSWQAMAGCEQSPEPVQVFELRRKKSLCSMLAHSS